MSPRGGREGRGGEEDGDVVVPPERFGRWVLLLDPLVAFPRLQIA